MQKLNLPCDRASRLSYIRTVFPHAPGPDLPIEWAGGRVNAMKRLSEVKAASYGKNRNFLNGDVTRLSAYLRHGCITLIEAVQSVRDRFGVSAEKLLFEFAWRDYWRQVWHHRGHDIFSDMEPPKVKLHRKPLETEVQEAQTGLPCMDAFINDLVNTGYVHNHARMWLASYLIHHRKIDWRAAADWFESYLLDGDLASNSLSWQWVASTFGSKPYFFNKENLSKYSQSRYCADCRVSCPFDADYETLQAQLFQPTTGPAKVYPSTGIKLKQVTRGNQAVVLVHDEMLSAAHPLLHLAGRKLFIFDPQLHGRWALHRLQFVADCLIELEDVEVWHGDIPSVLESLQVAEIKTQETPDLWLKALLSGFAVEYVPEVSIHTKKLLPSDLRRFSKYWQKVGPEILSG